MKRPEKEAYPMGISYPILKELQVATRRNAFPHLQGQLLKALWAFPFNLHAF